MTHFTWIKHSLYTYLLLMPCYSIQITLICTAVETRIRFILHVIYNSHKQVFAKIGNECVLFPSGYGGWWNVHLALSGRSYTTICSCAVPGSREGPLLFAEPFFARLTEISIVLIARFACAPIYAQWRPHETIMDLTNSVVAVSQNLRN